MATNTTEPVVEKLQLDRVLTSRLRKQHCVCV